MGRSIAQEPKGTTIVVTGAGSGIGYAITRRLLEAGYAVSAWDVGMDIPSNEPTDRHSPPQVDLV